MTLDLEDNEKNEPKFSSTVCYATSYSDFKMCLPCLLKWKEFPFEEGKDYTRFIRLDKKDDFVAKIDEQEKADPIKLNDKMSGNDRLQKILDQYTENVIKPKINEDILDFQHYIPVPSDFNEETRAFPWDMQSNLPWDFSQITVANRSTYYAMHNQLYWPIISTSEYIYYDAPSGTRMTYFMKTLRIVNPE